MQLRKEILNWYIEAGVTECIAEAPENSLGLPIHSPIDATVLKISEECIMIQSAERNGNVNE